MLMFCSFVNIPSSRRVNVCSLDVLRIFDVYNGWIGGHVWHPELAASLATGHRFRSIVYDTTIDFVR